MSAILLIFIPVLVVVLTVLVGLICFLVAVLFMRRRRGIKLVEDGGPLDLSKSDGVMGEGGTEGVEARWLENVEPDVREGYKRAKEWQEQYTPASSPTDITLSQFLSIQEKGVSAWAFEPDYEDNLSLYVQSRTEITFLSDGPGMAAREGGGNSVMANLPLPKLNEVYYFEVKMYEKPPATEVAIGLATKPYPSFRLPGWNRCSVAYFASDGFKSHNYPFTAASHGQPLAEGDVLGVGYRPRTGTVFFTRNGRKLDDAYTGLQKYNLFPTIGANGPCTIHVNLGQAGFVFIEAQVKKWGLAPMVGTLAPPPAYGSERGSILLDAGYGTPNAGNGVAGMNALLEAARARRLSNNSAESTSTGGDRNGGPQTPRSTNSSRRHRTAGRSQALPGSLPAVSSPLREQASRAAPGPGPTTAGSRRRALGRNAIVESSNYVSPTDTPSLGPRPPAADALESLMSEEEASDQSRRRGRYVRSDSESSAMEPNPPTPNLLDISMHSLHLPSGQYFEQHLRNRTDNTDSDEDEEEELEDEGQEEGGNGSGSGESDATARPGAQASTRQSPPPPGYAPLDPNMYANGLPANLPEELVNRAIAAMSDTP
ncbi:concanavalin A-like lectin/glucanase domain-containing protein [Kockovaella imperatae]|uniref:Concanavalin A-like lectin/glucanase domain-containing protein n=1 Tax=Kockovaella imperatae TaxID=4999 RepID=A0A1Y1U8W7_9TREE|nr:concanavalin A-like lectin/glucanase domain-containing protein [Kockovaella imperatae]ORX33994.1 concanavalin A-like lectin/glucanase domain-containing protein [Kockovaella imperatae]